MHIIFDFDGTIADSGGFVEEYLRTRHPRIDVRMLRTAGLQAFLRQHHIGSLQTAVGVWLMKRAMGKHIEELRPAIPKAVIRELALHHTLSILSSNSRENIKAFLIKEGMLQYFRIIHPDTSLFGKDRMMRRMMRIYHIRPEDAAYIGDEDRDIAAARSVGLRAVAVTWGYNEKRLLLKHSPDAIVRRPRDLLVALNTIQKRRLRRR